MMGVTIRGLLGRGPSLLTALAVVLGIAMVSGTFVLTDTFQKAFNNIFTESYAGTDAVVSGKQLLDFSSSGRAPVPAGLPGRDPGAAGRRGGRRRDLRPPIQLEPRAARRRRRHEDRRLGRRAHLRHRARLQRAAVLAPEPHAGAWARGADQVVIDANTASKEGYEVGDTIGVAALGPVEQYEITGIARFGSVDSIGGATFAVFDVPTAQGLFRKKGQFDSISVAAKEGTTPEQLVQTLAPLVPETAEVKTGAAQASADAKTTNDDIAFITYFLLGFGGVALFVGAFVIFNTLSITVAQRTRSSPRCEPSAARGVRCWGRSSSKAS